ncbi:gephyrin-like molybdotransferase receptor GlpR, partial [Corynebacterium lipophiloflavum]
MGSLSLIIVLIIVVWVIVLAPIVMGNNKPIRHSGDGYDATRVLHAGGSEPVVQRRRPKLSAADVHRHDNSAEADYEVVEAEAAPLASTGGSTAISLRVDEPEQEHIDGEVVVEEEQPAASGSTALSVLQAEAESGSEPVEDIEQDHYEVDASYASPGDYGYADEQPAVDAEAPIAEPEEVETEPVEDRSELTADEIAFAQNRRGRGGWDPEREHAARADRFKRRQRTLLGLIVAAVIAVVIAFVVSGWAWAAPAVTIALTVWYMAALRSVVKQERALHARRVRQLR